MIKIKKIALILLLFAFLNMALAPAAHADSWGANMAAAIWKETIEQLKKKIYETILAQLRITAIRIIQGRLLTLISGRAGSGGLGTNGQIISDWRQFIYGSAQKYSTQVTNNFFQTVSAGAVSGIQQNVINPAKSATNTDYWGMKPDLQNYVAEGKAQNIFNPGATRNPWQAWAAAAQPQNDLAFMVLRATSFGQEAYNSEVGKQKTAGTAGQGYTGTEKKTATSTRGPMTATSSQGGKVTVPPGSDYTGGQNITTPGSTVKDLASKVLGMNLDTVSLSQTIPDLVSNMVVSMLTQYLNQGIAQLTQKMDQQIMQIRSQTGLPTAQIQNFIQNGVRSTTTTTTTTK